MSRIAAILLLPIMIIFAIQPVIALHYCAGELQSLNLFSQQSTADRSRADRVDHGENHSCCDMYQTEPVHHDDEWHALGDRCCDTQLLELTTDDYQNKVEQTLSRLFPLSIFNVGDILTHLFKLSDSVTNSPIFHPDFPPGGLFLKDVSLLTYICIYRI